MTSMSTARSAPFRKFWASRRGPGCPFACSFCGAEVGTWGDLRRILRTTRWHHVLSGPHLMLWGVALMYPVESCSDGLAVTISCVQGGARFSCLTRQQPPNATCAYASKTPVHPGPSNPNPPGCSSRELAPHRYWSRPNPPEWDSNTGLSR